MSYFPEDIPYMSKEELRENGIRIPKDAYVEHEKAQLSQEGTTSDLISRQAAIEALARMMPRSYTPDGSHPADEEIFRAQEVFADCIEALEILPPAQPEPTDINAKEAVYNLAEKIGIHQLFALTVELRGEPIQPEPHEGHWIKHIDQSDGEQYECSRCGVLWEFTDGTPEDNEAYFCPKCGTKLITK